MRQNKPTTYSQYNIHIYIPHVNLKLILFIILIEKKYDQFSKTKFKKKKLVVCRLFVGWIENIYIILLRMQIIENNI